MARDDYVLGTPMPFNRYDRATQTVLEGYNYPVHDNITGADITVFVPTDGHHTEGTEQLVEAALEPIRANLARNPS